MSRRIGIWGGAFDPIHVGHLILAQEALTLCHLDELYWLPCGDPPHKSGPVASGAHRLRMVELAIQAHPCFKFLREEIDREGKSYTVRTLEQVSAKWEGSIEICLLIGADNAVDFGNWLDPDRVMSLAEVIVFGRPGFSVSDVPECFRKRMQFLETPLFEVSSTEIRRRLAAGEPIRYWVPDSVRTYLESEGLYEGKRDG